MHSSSENYDDCDMECRWCFDDISEEVEDDKIEEEHPYNCECEMCYAKDHPFWCSCHECLSDDVDFEDQPEDQSEDQLDIQAKDHFEDQPDIKYDAWLEDKIKDHEIICDCKFCKEKRHIDKNSPIKNSCTLEAFINIYQKKKKFKRRN